MKYKYLLYLNELNRKETHPCNHYKITEYDKTTKNLTLQRIQMDGTEGIECNVFDFLDQLTRFHCLYVENPEIIDREVVDNYVINRMLILQKKVEQEWVYVEKYNYNTTTTDNIYTLVIDYREPVVNAHNYKINIGNLNDIYFDCGMSKSKTIDAVIKLIKKGVSKIPEIRFLSKKEIKHLSSILEYEIDNLQNGGGNLYV